MGRDETPAAWFERADRALYRAKSGGRNQVQYASETRAGKATGFVRLVWQPAYSCGDSMIDEEHRILFGLANDLLNSIIAIEPPEETRKIIDRLLTEIARHFEHEEAILAGINYIGLHEHASLHNELLAKARRLTENFDNTTCDIGELFQFLVTEVVARHMLGADRAYFPFLVPQAAQSGPP